MKDKTVIHLFIFLMQRSYKNNVDFAKLMRYILNLVNFKSFLLSRPRCHFIRQYIFNEAGLLLFFAILSA